MPQVMLVGVITNGAEVVVIAFGAFPPDPEDWLLSARITHSTVMLNSRRSAV